MLSGTVSCFDLVNRVLIDLFVKTWHFEKHVVKMDCFHKQAH